MKLQLRSDDTRKNEKKLDQVGLQGVFQALKGNNHTIQGQK